MITNPQAKVVLCYGDSNTHGMRPEDGSRYPSNVRWTGQLQTRLGDEYYVVEEGLSARTTNFDDQPPEEPSRNGWTYFKASVASHAPLHVVIVMLGTNDLKAAHNKSPQDVAAALAGYCDFIASFAPQATILLVSPASITPSKSSDRFDEVSAQKSEQLAAEIKQLADKKHVPFYDATQDVTVGEDGVHWDEPSQHRFAEKIENLVRQLA